MSWWGTAATVGAAGYSAYKTYKSGSNSGGGGGEVPQDLDMRSPELRGTQQALFDFIKKYLPNYEPGKPYTGQRVAGMSPFESQGLGYLQKYLDQPGIGQLGTDARSVVSDTLKGRYDPRTSPYYAGLRTQAAQDSADAVNQTKRELGSSGKFFSSELTNKIGDIKTRTSDYLTQVLGTLFQQERNNQLNAVNVAEGMDIREGQIPLQKATAGTTIGALPRLLDQADLEAQYQDFLRQRNELGGVLNATTSFATGAAAPTPNEFRAYSNQPSGFERYLLPILQQGVNFFGQYSGKQ